MNVIGPNFSDGYCQYSFTLSLVFCGVKETHLHATVVCYENKDIRQCNDRRRPKEKWDGSGRGVRWLHLCAS